MSDNSAVEKLSAVLKPLMDSYMQEMKVHVTAENQQTQLLLTEVKQQIGVLEQLVSTKKTTKQPKTKPAADATDGASNGATADAPNGAAPAEAPATKSKENKMTFFKRMFKEDEEFRNEYLKNAELKKLIDESPDVQKKKSELQKLTTMSTIAYNYLKNNDTEFLPVLEQRLNAKKKADEDAAKEPPKEKEANSPEVKKK